MELPDHVTHYYLPDGPPFRNLPELRDVELAQVLARGEGVRRFLG